MKCKRIPLFLLLLLILTLTLSSCAPKSFVLPSDTGSTSGGSSSSVPDDFAPTDNNASTEPETEEIPYSEKMALQDAAPPDDEWDFRYASDFTDLSIIDDGYLVYDSKGYDVIFPDKSVSLSDIEAACAANPNISQKYKDFLINYATRWLELYPGSDLRVLYHNLQTLKIVEASSSELSNITLTEDAPACYVSAENTVYVRNDTDYSPGTSGYIILTHELTHVARMTRYTDENGNKIRVDYYPQYEHGNYASEALITLFAYEIQGLGDEGNRFYMLPYNYFKIILDCTGYNGADYMNHSVHYLCDKMDEYMEEDGNGLYMLLYFSAEAIGHYESHVGVDYDEEDIAAFHEYITRMYMKKYLDVTMTLDEAEAVYTAFIDTITANFDLSSSEQPVSEEDFRPYFEACLSELGIA